MQNVKSTDPDKKTLIEEGTEFKGSFTSSCPVVVRGKVEGDLTAPSLRVSPTGKVYGRVKVGDVVSEGELSGEFDADTIQLSGVVKDKTVVRAKSLQVKLAPVNGRMEVLFGECVLDVGTAPSKEAAIATAVEKPAPEKPAPEPAAPSANGDRKPSGTLRPAVAPPQEPARAGEAAEPPEAPRRPSQRP